MKKILIVIDYQKDFVNGALGFDGAESLDDKIAQKVRDFGKGNVFYTLDTHDENYLQTCEGKHLPIVHCVKGAGGWALFGQTAAALQDVDAIGFEKTGFGLQITPEILKVLPENPDSIELVGLVSNICVLSNAVIFKTWFSESEIIVDASCTDSFDKSLHTQALNVLEGLQVKVINREE